MKKVITFLILSFTCIYAYSCSCVPNLPFPAEGIQKEDQQARLAFWQWKFSENKRVFTARIKSVNTETIGVSNPVSRIKDITVHEVAAIGEPIPEKQLTLNHTHQCPLMLEPRVGETYVFFLANDPNFANSISNCNARLAQANEHALLSQVWRSVQLHKLQQQRK